MKMFLFIATAASPPCRPPCCCPRNACAKPICCNLLCCLRLPPAAWFAGSSSYSPCSSAALPKSLRISFWACKCALSTASSFDASSVSALTPAAVDAGNEEPPFVRSSFSALSISSSPSSSCSAGVAPSVALAFFFFFFLFLLVAVVDIDGFVSCSECSSAIATVSSSSSSGVSASLA